MTFSSVPETTAYYSYYPVFLLLKFFCVELKLMGGQLIGVVYKRTHTQATDRIVLLVKLLPFLRLRQQGGSLVYRVDFSVTSKKFGRSCWHEN